MPNRLILRILTVLAGVLLLSSCSEYQRALKNPDPNYKFEFAKRAFEQKKYVQSYTLLRDVVTQLKGSDRAEESLYLLGLSYFENQEYPEAAEFSKPTISDTRKGNSPNWHVTMPAMHTTSIRPNRNLTRARPSRPSRNCRDSLTISPDPIKCLWLRTPSSRCRIS